MVINGGSCWDLRDVRDIVDGVIHDGDVHKGTSGREEDVQG